MEVQLCSSSCDQSCEQNSYCYRSFKKIFQISSVAERETDQAVKSGLVAIPSFFLSFLPTFSVETTSSQGQVKVVHVPVHTHVYASAQAQTHMQRSCCMLCGSSVGKACGSGQRKKAKIEFVALLRLRWANSNLSPSPARPRMHTHAAHNVHSISLFSLYFTVIFVWNKRHVERRWRI